MTTLLAKISKRDISLPRTALIQLNTNPEDNEMTTLDVSI